MSNIVDLESGLFSNLQSEFYKFKNVLNKTNTNNNNLKKIILMNEQMRILENMLYELKIDLYSQHINKLNDINEPNINDELNDYEKNQKVIEYFKPYMVYYRFLLN